MYYLILIALLILSCTENDFQSSTDFRRSPSFFRIQISSVLNQEDDLLVASWNIPQSTDNLIGHYLVLDTNHWKNNEKKFFRFDSRNTFDRPAIYIPWEKRTSDSLLFLLDSLTMPFEKITTEENLSFFKIDSNKHINANKLHFTFALIPVYSSGLPGETHFSQIVVSDLFSPQLILSQASALDSNVTISWQRPLDQTNFFNDDPSNDTGIVLGYHVVIEDQDNSNLISFKPLNLKSLKFKTPQKTLSLTKENLDSALTIQNNNTNRGRIISFFLKDSTSHKKNSTDNKISLTLNGLFSQQTYRYFIYAKDKQNNFNQRDAEQLFFTTTDNTKPILTTISEIVQSRQNQIKIKWNPSQDTRSQDTQANANILQYFMEITEKINGVTFPPTQIKIPQEHNQDTLFSNQNIILYPTKERSFFQLERNFLIPNTLVTLKIFSQDSSLYFSDTAVSSISTVTLIDSTKTNFRCPSNFNAVITQDTFCIQSYEYQNQEKQFITQVTLQEAIKTCQDLSSSKDSIFLCSENQWERSCQGSRSLQFGIQSIDPTQPNITLQVNDLQSLCNIETGNSSISEKVELRNPQCTTNEGVYDLPGNFSEWVSSTDGRLIFKGANYLQSSGNFSNPERAKCLFDGSPQNLRPNFLPSCISKQANLSFILNNDSLICPKLNKPVSHFEWITKSINNINSPRAGARIFFSDDTQDSLFFSDSTGSNITARTGQVNPKNLLVVQFQNKNDTSIFAIDTLDFSPFQFFDSPIILDQPSSHTLLSQITSPQWEAIPIKILYSTFIIDKTTNSNQVLKDAKIYYNHQALGFRCCSKPK